MGYKRPKATPEIWEAFAACASYQEPKLPLGERRARWQRLYDKYFLDGEWRCTPFDVGLIWSMGVWSLFEAGEYELARSLNREYIRYAAMLGEAADEADIRQWLGTKYRRSESGEILEAFGWEAKFALLLGEIEEGVALVRRALPDAKGHFKSFNHTIQWVVPWMLSTMPASDPADARLQELVVDIAVHQRDYKKRIEALRQAKTNQELLDVLDPEGTARRPSDWPA